MLRFRNPSSDLTTQITVFRALYEAFKQREHFDLDDMKSAVENNPLMSSYGYTGIKAVTLSSQKPSSLDSIRQNMKMLAEIYRMYGWITPALEDKSYPVRFTFVGKHAGDTSPEGAKMLIAQALLGFVNPAEATQGVKYDERVRFFVTALRTIKDLGGEINKKELCMGPMSVNDNSEAGYQEMLAKLRSMRPDSSRLNASFTEFCKALGMKENSVTNTTRFPIGAMKSLGWISTKHKSDIYAGSRQSSYAITSTGENVLAQVSNLVDIRLDHFNRYEDQAEKQDALCRLGVHSLLKRAGFLVENWESQVLEDEAQLASILRGREVLFSPYQTLRGDKVDAALLTKEPTSQGFVKDATVTEVAQSSAYLLERPRDNIITVPLSRLLIHNDQGSPYVKSQDSMPLKAEMAQYYRNNVSLDDAIDAFFDSRLRDKQREFYPLISELFGIAGIQCEISRQGDNSVRWDALITAGNRSVPVEIKSPTEEVFLSLKAVRQALENKVVLTSRYENKIQFEDTSLVVGYHLPNERSAVKRLIENFKHTYGVRIGVFGLKDLLRLAYQAMIDNAKIDLDILMSFEGIADESFSA